VSIPTHDVVCFNVSYLLAASVNCW